VVSNVGQFLSVQRQIVDLYLKKGFDCTNFDSQLSPYYLTNEGHKYPFMKNGRVNLEMVTEVSLLKEVIQKLNRVGLSEDSPTQALERIEKRIKMSYFHAEEQDQKLRKDLDEFGGFLQDELFKRIPKPSISVYFTILGLGIFIGFLFSMAFRVVGTNNQ